MSALETVVDAPLEPPDGEFEGTIRPGGRVNFIIISVTPNRNGTFAAREDASE
jgi:hypothetical protein